MLPKVAKKSNLPVPHPLRETQVPTCKLRIVTCGIMDLEQAASAGEHICKANQHFRLAGGLAVHGRAANGQRLSDHRGPEGSRWSGTRQIFAPASWFLPSNNERSGETRGHKGRAEASEADPLGEVQCQPGPLRIVDSCGFLQEGRSPLRGFCASSAQGGGCLLQGRECGVTNTHWHPGPRVRHDPRVGTLWGVDRDWRSAAIAIVAVTSTSPVRTFLRPPTPWTWHWLHGERLEQLTGWNLTAALQPQSVINSRFWNCTLAAGIPQQIWKSWSSGLFLRQKKI